MSIVCQNQNQQQQQQQQQQQHQNHQQHQPQKDKEQLVQLATQLRRMKRRAFLKAVAEPEKPVDKFRKLMLQLSQDEPSANNSCGCSSPSSSFLSLESVFEEGDGDEYNNRNSNNDSDNDNDNDNDEGDRVELPTSKIQELDGFSELKRQY